MGYIRGFAGVAGVVEVVRRSIMTNAEFERSMNCVKIEGGAMGESLDGLQHKFEELASVTGKSMEEVTGSFRAFRDAIGGKGGEGLDKTFETFDKIHKAAEVAGVSFETLGKSAVEAIKVLHVPMTEIEGVLANWTENIPASMMAQWSQASTGIMGSLKDIGYTGEEAAKTAGTAFGNMASALGDAGRAGSLLQSILDKSTDTGTAFGRSMVGMVQQMGSSALEGGALLDASYEKMKSYGVYQEDLASRDMARKIFAKGWSAQQLRDLEEAAKLERKIQAEHQQTGVDVDTLRKKYGLLTTDSQAEINKLVGASKQLFAEIGKAFGTSTIKAFTDIVKTTGQELRAIARIVRLIFPADRAKTTLERLQEGQKPPPTTGGFLQRRFNPLDLFKGNAAQPNFPGMATGGAFQVEGAGGIDQQPVGFMATPGEKVAVTTPTQESLQQQQDKADIAAREHFARFHQTAFTKTTSAPWWPGGGVRGLGAGGGGAGAGGGMGGLPGMGQAPGYGSGRGGGGGKDGTGGGGDDGTAGPPQLKQPVGLDTTSATGPAEDLKTAYERGYLTPPTTAASGNAYLAQERQHLVDQYTKNPGLKLRVAAMASLEHEGDAKLVVELLYNRINLMKSRGQGYAKSGSIDSALNSGFYGPINKGALQQRMKELERNPARLAKIMAQIDAAHTSNVLEGATDQGSGNDPNVNWQGGRKKINGEVYNDWDGPGGHEGSRKYREEQQRRVAAAGNVEPKAGEAPGQTPIGNIAAAVRQGQTFDSSGNVIDDPNAGGAGSSPGAGAGVIKMMNQGAIRDKPLNQNTKNYLEYASLQTGLEVHVGSGGQDVVGKRTGSHRHDLGGAADYKLWDPTKNGGKGGYLDFNNADDKKQMEKFVTLTSRAGATGQGAGAGYMGTQTIHTGGGTEATWGEEGKGGFISRGAAAGKQGRLTPDQLQKQLAELRQQKATRLADAEKAKQPQNKPADAPTNTKVATAAPAVGQKTDAQLDTAGGKPGTKVAADPPAPVRRMPSAPGYEGVIPGKPGGGGGGATPHPVSPQADPIPGKQWGGEVRGGRSYTVGESGPETFTPTHPGSITPGTGGIGGMMDQYRQFADMMRAPIVPNLQMPRAGPIRQRMSRHVEAQRERDVGRMTRHASHSDIGFS